MTTPPPPGTPNPYWSPPLPPSPASKKRQRIIGLAVVAGVILVSTVLGFAIAAIKGTPGRSGPAFTVAISACTLSEGSLATGSVDLTVTNNTTATRTARIDVEYRDSGGRRIDTDTAIIRDIPPGDTVRHTEYTILDAGASGGQCRIVGMR